jgi:thiamine-phosphate pyrophosphorylase
MSKILPGVGEGADLYGITDSRLSLDRPVTEVVGALLAGGVTIIQYREKDKHAGEMLRECRDVRALTRAAGACFIVNDHVDIAILCEADGVHVGQEDLPVPEVRRLAGSEMIVGLSTHSPAQARAALEAGADYIGVGPLFATRTKADVVAPVTLDYLDWVVANITLPFVAIGGIKRHNIHEVARRGAKCCALVSELDGAEDIVARVAEVRRAMRNRP